MPGFGSQAKFMCVLETSDPTPVGSEILRVYGRRAEKGPGTTPKMPFGKLARTFQWKSPVPHMSVGVTAAVGSPLRSWCFPSGRSADTSYETAPGTEFHVHVGMTSPSVGPPGLGTASRFWKVCRSDHV